MAHSDEPRREIRHVIADPEVAVNVHAEHLGMCLNEIREAMEAFNERVNLT